MLSLNLISHESKHELKLRKFYGLLNNISLILVIFVITLTSTILLAKIVLQNSFNNIVEQTSMIIRNSQGYNSRVRAINSQLSLVSSIQGEYTQWSTVLKNVASNTPDGVTFSYLRASRDNKTIVIRGRATERNKLIEFKNNLENSSILKDIDFPIQNILKEKDIDFEIKGVINNL